MRKRILAVMQNGWAELMFKKFWIVLLASLVIGFVIPLTLERYWILRLTSDTRMKGMFTQKVLSSGTFLMFVGL